MYNNDRQPDYYDNGYDKCNTFSNWFKKYLREFILTGIFLLFLVISIILIVEGDANNNSVARSIGAAIAAFDALFGIGVLCYFTLCRRCREQRT